MGLARKRGRGLVGGRRGRGRKGNGAEYETNMLCVYMSVLYMSPVLHIINIC